MIRPANSSFWAAVSDMVGGGSVGAVVNEVPVTKASSGSGSGSRYEFDAEERRGGGGSGLLVLASVQCYLCPDSASMEHQYFPVPTGGNQL